MHAFYVCLLNGIGRRPLTDERDCKAAHDVLLSSTGRSCFSLAQVDVSCVDIRSLSVIDNMRNATAATCEYSQLKCVVGETPFSLDETPAAPPCL